MSLSCILSSFRHKCRIHLHVSRKNLRKFLPWMFQGKICPESFNLYAGIYAAKVLVESRGVNLCMEYGSYIPQAADHLKFVGRCRNVPLTIRRCAYFGQPLTWFLILYHFTSSFPSLFTNSTLPMYSLSSCLKMCLLYTYYSTLPWGLFRRK